MLIVANTLSVTVKWATYKSPPIYLIMNQINLVYDVTLYFLKTQFNIILLLGLSRPISLVHTGLPTDFFSKTLCTAFLQIRETKIELKIIPIYYKGMQN